MAKDHNAMVLGWMIPLLVVTLMFVFARFASKFAVSKTRFGADDWVMAAAVFFGAIQVVVDIVSIKWGVGWRSVDTPDVWYNHIAPIRIVIDIVFPLATSLSKISLCLTYLRLFPSRANKIFCWTVIAYLICYTISFILVQVFGCLPVLWNGSVVPTTCINWRVALTAFGALNTVSDFLVFLWPAPQLWAIHLPWKERVSLIMVFAVGCSVCIIGVCRMWYLQYYYNFVNDYGDDDWLAATANSLGDTEICLGIICGCIPSLRPILVRIFPRVFASSKISSQRTPRRPGDSNSFPFQVLSGSGRTDQGASIAAAESVEKDKDGVQSYAWACAPGMEIGNEEGRLKAARGRIQVHEDILVDSEPRGGRDSDRGSEEWIIKETSSALP